MTRVRTLRNEDLKGARGAMAEHEAMHFSAVMMLRTAVGPKADALAIAKAKKLLAEAYELEIKADESAKQFSQPFPPPEDPEEERRDFARAMTELLALPPDQPVKALFKKGHGRAAGNPRWLLSCEISKFLQEARLVLWWSGEQFMPAILCPDRKTAFYATALLGMFRICPHCSGPFFPERSDQEYCSISHREAHRVARWRAQQKRKASRKESKRGSRKAR